MLLKELQRTVLLRSNGLSNLIIRLTDDRMFLTLCWASFHQWLCKGKEGNMNTYCRTQLMMILKKNDFSLLPVSGARAFPDSLANLKLGYCQGFSSATGSRPLPMWIEEGQGLFLLDLNNFRLHKSNFCTKNLNIVIHYLDFCAWENSSNLSPLFILSSLQIIRSMAANWPSWLHVWIMWGESMSRSWTGYGSYFITCILTWKAKYVFEFAPKKKKLCASAAGRHFWQQKKLETELNRMIYRNLLVWTSGCSYWS